MWMEMEREVTSRAGFWIIADSLMSMSRMLIQALAIHRDMRMEKDVVHRLWVQSYCEPSQIYELVILVLCKGRVTLRYCCMGCLVACGLADACMISAFSITKAPSEASRSF